MNYKELAFWLYCGDYCEVERLGLWQQVNALSWVPWGLKQMHIWSERFNPIGFTTKCRCLQSNLISENVIIKLTSLSVCLRHTETPSKCAHWISTHCAAPPSPFHTHCLAWSGYKHHLSPLISSSTWGTSPFIDLTNPNRCWSCCLCSRGVFGNNTAQSDTQHWVSTAVVTPIK